MQQYLKFLTLYTGKVRVKSSGSLGNEIITLGRRDTIIGKKIMVEEIFGEIWKDKEMEYGMNTIINIY